MCVHLSKMNETNLAHKLNVTSAKKKKADNDAQLLLNRINLLKKEEDKAKKRLEQTKEKAMTLVTLRDEEERRLQEKVLNSQKERQTNIQLQERSKVMNNNLRASVSQRTEEVIHKRMKDVETLKSQKQLHSQQIKQDQEKEFEYKRQLRDSIRQKEEERRLKRQQELQIKEQQRIQDYLNRVSAEEEEAKRAEARVRELEQQERIYLKKLQHTQEKEEEILYKLETLLQPGTPTTSTTSTNHSSSLS